jgi:hypothetical protein
MPATCQKRKKDGVTAPQNLNPRPDSNAACARLEEHRTVRDDKQTKSRALNSAAQREYLEIATGKKRSSNAEQRPCARRLWQRRGQAEVDFFLLV